MATVRGSANAVASRIKISDWSSTPVSSDRESGAHSSCVDERAAGCRETTIWFDPSALDDDLLAEAAVDGGLAEERDLRPVGREDGR